MSEFNTPLSNTEAILQNLLGAENELKDPQSNIEAMLMNELGGDWPEREPQSRVEVLVKEVLEGVEPHPTLINKSITGNGIYDPHDDNADGYKKVSVAVAPNVTSKNITANGDYAASADNVDGYSSVHVDVPANVGTKTVTVNGIYNAVDDNVDGYSSVNVEVPSDLTTKTITENGTYNAVDDEADGYSSVTVEVEPDLMAKTIYSNGTYRASSDNKDGYSEVTVNVDPDLKLYGFHIDSNESDPTACITYLEDAVGMTPAHMDFTNDVWDWGSWENAFFIPKPCMVKYDGTVDYYLDPNDYTKKEDGETPSDIADTAYEGNAMMEWPKIYMKIVPDANDDTSASIYFSNKKIDETWTFWQYIDVDGNEIDKMYTAIYKGVRVSGKLRSMSGLTPIKFSSVNTEINAANANNINGKTEWNIGLYSDWMLIAFLKVLITKTLKTTQSNGFGKTYNSANVANGVLNNKGLFYGKNNSGNSNKLFGMENWYGCSSNLVLGAFITKTSLKVKLCYGQSDGTTVNDYNKNGSGYLTVNVPGFGNGNYLKTCKFSNLYIIPNSIGATSSTYYSTSLDTVNNNDPYFFHVPTMATNRYSDAHSIFGFSSYMNPKNTAYTYNTTDYNATLSLKPIAPTT